MAYLNEDSRNQLLSKSKSSSKGFQRYKRRLKSKVAHSVRSFNSLDMNNLFKRGIFTLNLPVQGETDKYTCRISFGGFTDILQSQLKRVDRDVALKDIIRTLIIGFNKDDIFISCSCPDFFYRFGYWATRNKINSGAAQNIPSNVTNPRDTLGSGCKHLLLVLGNASWITKAGSTIYNYINYMKKYYPKVFYDIMYPTIYGREYEGPVQLSVDDSDDLDSTEQTLDTSNEIARTRGRFKPGNQSGIQFAGNLVNKDQEEFEEDT